MCGESFVETLTLNRHWLYLDRLKNIGKTRQEYVICNEYKRDYTHLQISDRKMERKLLSSNGVSKNLTTLYDSELLHMFITKSRGKLKMTEVEATEMALAEDQVSVPRAHMVDYNSL